MNMATKSLKRNALMGMLNTIINMIFPLIIFIYVSRKILPEGIGITQLANSISGYFELFASLGIPLYAVREIAKNREDNKLQNINSIEIFWTNLINATIVFAIYFLFVTLVYGIGTISFWVFIIYGSIIITNAIGVEWYFKANEEFTYIAIRNLIIKSICTLLIILFVKTPNDILLYSIIYVGSTVLYSILNLFVFAFRTKLKPIKFKYLKHLKPALSVFLLTFASTIYTSMDTLMLGYLLGNSGNYAVGIYSASHKITNSFITIITAINAIMLPRLSYYYEKQEFEKIKNILNTCYQFILLIAIPLVVACEIFAENMVYLLSGAEFLEASSVLRIAAPTILFVSITNLIGIQIFYSSGNVKKTIISVVCGAVVNLITNFSLILPLKQNGVAIGTVLAEFTVLVVQLIIGKELLIFNKFDKNIIKILIATLIMCATIIPIKIFVNLSLVYSLLLCAVVGVIVYFLAIILLKEKYFQLFLKEIKHKFKKEK